MQKIAIIVQRFGKEVNGGAELHAQLLAQHLKEKYQVDVLTSCSLDHHKWDNHYLEGEQFIDGIRVLRFRNENEDKTTPRRISRYLVGNQVYNKIKYTFTNFLILGFRRFKYRTKKDHNQLFDRWIVKHGPVSTKMISFLEKEMNNYKVFIFFSYLYYPTYFGLQKTFEKSILIPTAHDEPIFYFREFGKMFSLPKFIMYNTEDEKNLVELTYPDTMKIRSDIAGVGFELPNFDANTTIPINSPYFVYIGRIDVNKGCGKLIDNFSKLTNSELKLVMIGKNNLKKPINTKNIIFTGFIDEQEKLSFLQHCKGLIIPSRYESLSMVTLEAMSAGIPVLANGYCNVLKTHIERSNAGFIYYDEKDFDKMITKIINLSENEKEIIAQKGKAYVEKNYQWKSIMNKFDSAIDYVSSF